LEAQRFARDPFKFEKRCQLFFRSHNETLPGIAVRVNPASSLMAAIAFL
jgi:hypothetical protein